jgi:hypothetical protein
MKWILRLTMFGLFLLVFLITLILNPSFLYAHKTTVDNYNIYHNKPIDSIVLVRLTESTKIIKSSELFDPNLKYDICLDDGSWYPPLIKTIFREPLGNTFYNKIVFWGAVNFKENFGFDGTNKWNMTQLIAHTQTHCLQFNKYGFWKSNPIAHHPNWKWEGYAEYISRKLVINNDLPKNIDRLIQAEKTMDNNRVEFSDGTGSSIAFYKMRLLVQYCSDIKKINFEQLLKDTTTEEAVRQEMMSWYKNELLNNDLIQSSR